MEVSNSAKNKLCADRPDREHREHENIATENTHIEKGEIRPPVTAEFH